jgi:hypothetical protein
MGLLTGGVAAYLLQPTDERIDSLEATVANLDERVTALEEDSELVAATPDATAAAANVVGGDWLTVSGVGNTVTEKFNLEAGRYRVHAALNATGATGFITQFYGPSGDKDLVFNALISDAGEWTSEAIYEAQTPGAYFVEVSNVMGAVNWSLAFEPF